MPKVTLDRRWSYRGIAYGPGDAEIPDGLAQQIEQDRQQREQIAAEQAAAAEQQTTTTERRRRPRAEG